MAEEGEPGAAVHLPLDHLVLVLTPADRGPGVCQFTLQSRDGDRTGREHPIELTDPEILATVGPPSTHPLNEGWPSILPGVCQSARESGAPGGSFSVRPGGVVEGLAYPGQQGRLREGCFE